VTAAAAKHRMVSFAYLTKIEGRSVVPGLIDGGS
jgi:hypothetical protein